MTGPDLLSTAELLRSNDFEVLGLPVRLRVDPADLERRVQALHRRLHPDRFAGASEDEKSRSLEASARVNEAHRTIRDTVARGRYWLELHGDRFQQDNNRVPPGFVDAAFEIAERLEEWKARRGGPDEAALRRDLEARRATLGPEESDRRKALETLYASEPPEGGARDPEYRARVKAALTEYQYVRRQAMNLEAALEES